MGVILPQGRKRTRYEPEAKEKRTRTFEEIMVMRSLRPPYLAVLVGHDSVLLRAILAAALLPPCYSPAEKTCGIPPYLASGSVLLVEHPEGFPQNTIDAAKTFGTASGRRTLHSGRYRDA